MRTRDHDFFDSKSVCAKYSFQVFINGKWASPCVVTKGKKVPVMFDSESERDAARKEWSRRREATCQKD